MSFVISSATNPKIKFALNLQQKKYRDKHGLFMLEGVRNAELAIASASEIQMCFVTEKAMQNDRAQSIVNQLEKTSCLVYTVPESIYHKISDTESPQGLMLVIKMMNTSLDELLPTESKSPFYLVLDRLQDPGNIGTIIRTADAMGVSGILCLNKTCDIFSPKVVRSAMGSLFNVPIVTKLSEIELLRFVQKNSLKLYATALDKTAVSCWNADFTSGCVVILGNEANGICRELLDSADEKIYIPMAGNAESLNVANACSMIIYERCRQNI